MSQIPNNPDPHVGAAESAIMEQVPETIVGELQIEPVPTHRSQVSGSIDRVYDFHPGRVVVRVDGPDVMAIACDSSISFVAAHLVTPDGTSELVESAGMFVGTHDDDTVFRMVLESSDDSKRYSTGWIQR